MILFRHIKLNKWVNTDDNSRWVLTDDIDMEKSKFYDYDFVNEIMEDLKCDFEDILIFENI
mgnify:CR=1 FL=1